MLVAMWRKAPMPFASRRCKKLAAIYSDEQKASESSKQYHENTFRLLPFTPRLTNILFAKGAVCTYQQAVQNPNGFGA